MAAPVKRKLTFYAWESPDDENPFHRLAVAEQVQQLKGNEVIFDDDGKLYAVAVSKKGSQTVPTCFTLLRLRSYEDRPLLFKPGSSPRAISHGSDEYTSDVTHISIWEDGFAGYDAHGNAPGPVRLGRYLRDRVDAKVEFVALYNRDLIDRLKALDRLTTVEFSVSRSEKAQLATDSGKAMFSGLRSARQGYDTLSFGTSLSVGRRRGAALDEGLRNEIIALAPDAETYFDRLQVTGYRKDGAEETREEINLLKERVHREESLPRATGGGDWPNPTTCFTRLNAVKKELQQAGELDNAVRSRAPTKIKTKTTKIKKADK